MGSIRIVVTGDASVGTIDRAWDWQDADINRLVTWAKTAYPTPPTPEIPEPPPPSTAQAVTRWARGVLTGTKDNIRREEKIGGIEQVPDPPPIDDTVIP